MSYIATDFDNLNAGINILNLTDIETGLLPYEGTYSDKGKGYKQQYLTYGDELDIPHLIMDFCFIFKDGFTTSNVTYLSLLYDDVLDFVTPTITADSDGNVVWLFENADTWDFNAPLSYDYVYFNWNKGNEDFYYYIASNYALDNKQPDDFDIVRFFSTRPNVTFEAHRSSPTSNVIEMTFDGSFYNGSLGLVNNALQSIEVYHYDDLYNKVTDKLLVQNTDFTIDGNRVYSGTLSTPSVISITTGILYNQAKNIFLGVRTTANSQYFLYMITKGIPVCNWKEGEFYINGDLIVCDGDATNPVNLLKSYSTTEKMIGYWINGEPLYRKVINFGTLPNSATKNVAHNISNLKDVVRLEGIASYTAGGNKGWMALPLQYAGANSTHNIQMSASTSNITITTNTVRSNYTAYVIIEYTKED